ncbi:putative Polycomb group protein ASXL3 [Lineus longissimus]|uniref:putative Polycomb group protein ASXL3 n=1 Tax=Lineus longissimus TaxID=88925 RepID=UPI00315C8EC6
MPAIRETVLNHTFRYLKFFNKTLIPIEVGAADEEKSHEDVTPGIPAMPTPDPPGEVSQTTVTSPVTIESVMTSTQSSAENTYGTTLAQKLVDVVSNALNSTISTITDLVHNKASSASNFTSDNDTLPISTIPTPDSVQSSADSNVSYHEGLSNRTLSSLQTFHNVTTLLPDVGNQTQSESSSSSVIPLDLVPDRRNATKSILENVTNSTYQALQYVTNSTVADIKEVVPTATSFLTSDTTKSTYSTSERLSTSALPTHESSTNSTFTSLLGFTNKTVSALIDVTNTTISAVGDATESSTYVQREKPADYDIISEADDINGSNLNTTRLNHNWTITEVGHHPEINRGATDQYSSDPSQLLYIFAILGAYVIIICALVLIQMRRRNRYETLDDEYYDEYLMRQQMLTERRTLLKMNIKNIRGVKDGYLLDKILQNEEV